MRIDGYDVLRISDITEVADDQESPTPMRCVRRLRTLARDEQPLRRLAEWGTGTVDADVSPPAPRRRSIPGEHGRGVDKQEFEDLEAEVTRTSALLLRAAALADRMAQRPPSPTLPENLRRLHHAVERGREHMLEVLRAEQR